MTGNLKLKKVVIVQIAMMKLMMCKMMIDEQSDDMKGIAGNEMPKKSVYEEKREKEQVQKVDDKMSTPSF